MKIEKLNEDKIKITLNLEDLKDKNIDFQSFMANSIETQNLFLDMLNEAEKQIGFVTKDYKIMIEALAMSDGNFVLTVTRTEPNDTFFENRKARKLKVRRKKFMGNTNLFCFNSFDDFTEFCRVLNSTNIKGVNKLLLKSNLYLFKSYYYLVLHITEDNSELLKTFYSIILEYSTQVTNSELFEKKLSEYGNLIIKNTCMKNYIKYFV